MLYKQLADVYEDLENHPSKLKKTKIVANLLKESGEDLQKIVLLLRGKVFPRWSEEVLGVANQLMIKAVAKATGLSSADILNQFKSSGDLGKTAEQFISNKKQRALLSKKLTVEKVFENIKKIAKQEGKNSQERKLDLIAELLISSSPKEAKYIIGTVLEQLRIGVAEGILRDAIMEAFLLKYNIGELTKQKLQQAKGEQKLRSEKIKNNIGERDNISALTKDKPHKAKGAPILKKEKLTKGEQKLLEQQLIQERKRLSKIVENAWFLNQDYSEIAQIARDKGERGLQNVKIELGKPIAVLLAEKSPSLKEALEKFENPILEFKYDGARMQIEKKENQIWIYTRRAENISNQFPEVVKWCKENLKPKNCIIDGECVAIDPKTKRPLSFQHLSQRIKRKYHIQEIMKTIPVQLNIFDMIYLEGKNLLSKSLEERKILLKENIKEIKEKFQLAKFLVTKDLKKADRFYKQALDEGHEGLIVKNLDAIYQPGRRVSGGWLKVKPVMETLDLVIIGGVWGMGKRAGWFGSFFLGCRDPETGKFMECGMLGTGIKEKDSEITFEKLTKMLKPLIEKEKEHHVFFKPKIIIEVAYEEIQKSPTYNSGWALRFPRLKRLRFDKSISDVDTLERIERLYKQQKGKK